MPAEPRRVPLEEVAELIAVGEPLPFRVLDRQARLLLSAGQRVANEVQMESLVERGAWAEGDAVDAERQRRGATTRAAASNCNRRDTLFERWEQEIWALDSLLRNFSSGAEVGAALYTAVDRQIALIDRHPDIAIFIAMRQDDLRFAIYPLSHAVYTGTLCVFAARQLGWDVGRVRALLAGSLTMNAAMLELQATMAEQREPPTPQQMKCIREHPDDSARMLATGGVPDIGELVRDHHEQQGGGGYARGLSEVPDDTRLLRAADVFMAKISPRAFRAPMTPQAAARQLFQQERGGAIAGALIKAVGVNPPGSLVQLANGEIGVVASRAGAGGGSTVVAAITDRAARPVTETNHRHTSDPLFAIQGPAPAGVAIRRIPGERVYGMVEP